MVLFRYPLPEPRWILSHHAALRFLFSEMVWVIFQHECPRDIDGTRLRFCSVGLPFVSSMEVFPSSLVSPDLPVCEYGEPRYVLLNRKVHIDPQELVEEVRFGWSERIGADGLLELPLASVGEEYHQIVRRAASCPSHDGRQPLSTSLGRWSSRWWLCTCVPLPSPRTCVSRR